jgi:gamma-glutamylcyclotransferase (GGCT)/AIG2-like uncharacterized protein YtfP
MASPDRSTPFFTYGLLRPGQPAFHQIRDMVDRGEVADAPGTLLVQDGLPILKESTGSVQGILLTFKPESGAKAYDTIRKFEPASRYTWRQKTIGGGPANVLYAAHPESGNPIDWPDWNGWRDPLFREALETISRTRPRNRESNYNNLFRLQMAYLLLWSSIERFVALRYGATDTIESGVNLIAEEDGFAELVRQHVPKVEGEPASVIDSRFPDRPEFQLDPSRPRNCLNFYRRIRHNVTHRGKSGPTRDTELLNDSLDQLLPIFEGLLANAEREAKEDYERVIGHPPR